MNDEHTVDVPIIPVTPGGVEATAAGVPVLPVGMATGMQTQAAPVNRSIIAKSRRLTVAGYELFEELGRGGMGVVYRASQLSLGRDIALKFLREEYHPTSRSGVRFLEEARITAQLQHPGIPAIHEVGKLDDDRPYLVMKLIQGKTLDALLKAEGPHPTKWLSAFENICNAVGYAHARGIIHRDLKPANVMVGAFGEVQVMDWGLAKALGATPATEMSDNDANAGHSSISSSHSATETQAGALLGTPAFMAPEQAIGAVDLVDCRSDVFGLGAVLCALLTGNPPYVNRTVERTRQMAAKVDLSQANERLDSSGAAPEIIALCRRCLSADREARPATGLELAKEIARIRRRADERAIAAEREKAEAAVMLAEQKKRRMQSLIAGGIIVAVFAAGAVVSLLQANRATKERDNAQAAEKVAKKAEEDARNAEQVALEREQAERTAREEAEAVAMFMRHVFAQGSAAGQASRIRQVNRNLTVKAAMDYASRTIRRDFENNPLMEAALRRSIGRTYYELGALPEAADNFRKALELSEAHRGPDDLLTLEISNDLALVLQLQNDFSAAQSLLERVIETCERTLGQNAVQTLSARSNLAMLLSAKGDQAAATPILIDVLAGAEKHVGPLNPVTLTFANNLGVVYDRHGDFAKAEPIFLHVFDVRGKLLGFEHPDTIVSLNNLANLYEAKQDFRKSQELLEKALASCQAALGDDHPSTLLVKNNLGNVLALQGNLADAEPLLEAAYSGQVKKLGPLHPDTVATLRNRVNLAINRKDAAAAAGRLRKLAEIHRQTGLDYADTVKLLENYVQLSITLGNDDDARRVFLEVFDALKPDLPAERRESVLESLGRRCLGWRWPEEAAVIFRELLALRLRDAPASWQVPAAQSLLGEALTASGKYVEAWPLLLEGYEGLQAKRKLIPIDFQHQIRDAGERILRWCQASGDKLKRAEWEAKLRPEVAPEPRKK